MSLPHPDTSGLFTLSYACYSLLPPPLHGSRFWAAPLGTLTGLTGTIFGTGDPFTVIYPSLRDLDKASFRGTAATFFAIDSGMRLMGFTLSGYCGMENLPLILTMLPIMALGLYMGGHIHTNISRQAFVHLVAFILFGNGIALLLTH